MSSNLWKFLESPRCLRCGIRQGVGWTDETGTVVERDPCPESPFLSDSYCSEECMPPIWRVTFLPSGVVVAPTLEAENSVEARKIAATEYGGDPGQYLAERWGKPSSQVR